MKPYYDEDGITIYHGDCLVATEWLTGDVMVTDPPYGIGWSRGINRRRASKAHVGIVNDENTAYRDAALDLAANLPAMVFGSFYAPFPDNLRQVLVWHKPPDSGVVGSTTGFRRDAEPIFLVGPWPIRNVERSSVMRTLNGISGVTTETGHPHTKPLGLMRELVSLCPPGVIVDPFMGSGTTLRAAKDLGRSAIGVEIEEHWCETAVQRLAQGVLAL